MQKKVTLAMAMMMTLVLFSAAALADHAMETTASITFEDGDLEFLDAGMSDLNNMDISFGTNAFPMGDVQYKAQDGAHTLRVSDPKTTAGGWRVTVKLGKFDSTKEGSDNSFLGDIELTKPTSYISNNTDYTNLTVANPMTLVGGKPDAVEVMRAVQGFKKGWFDAAWEKEDIKLSIDEENALKITDDEPYQAIMTWALIDGL